MKPALVTLYASLLCFCTITLFAEETSKPIEGIGPTGPMRLVSEGHFFTEGPAADAHGQLYFTDVFRAKVHRLLSDGKAELLFDQSSGINGLMFDKQGRLFGCQGGKGRIVTIDVESREITAFADGYAGKPFNRPNDLVIDSQGGVYFTDPKNPKGKQDKAAFYYASANGDVTRLGDDVNYPNGIILSPDEKTLYVLPYRGSEVMAFSVASPGKIGSGRVLSELQRKPGGKKTGGDGMTVDRDGNLYVAVPGVRSIQVITPDGTTLGLIPVPKSPSNCTFGGADLKTLYITAVQHVYAVPMQAVGHRFGGE